MVGAVKETETSGELKGVAAAALRGTRPGLRGI